MILICNSCGWAHFGLSKEVARKSIKEFIEYYGTLTPEQKESYYVNRQENYVEEDLYRKYELCFNCGGSREDFHIETEEDKVPAGVTLQPIINN